MRTYGSFVTRGFFIVAALAVLATPAAAQTPTPEQLQLFQNLTPEQQQAVLDRVASGGAEQPSGDSASGAATGTKPVEMAARVPAKVEPVIPAAIP
jgi:hypothetical protein